jgi:hypothetical protein
MGGWAMVRSLTRLIVLAIVVLATQFFSFTTLLAQPNWTFTRTSLSSVIAIPVEIEPNVDGVLLESGDYIGVFYDSLGTLACAGFVIWDAVENVGLTAYGDDVQITPNSKEGLAANEAYKWKVWRASDQQEFDMKVQFDAQTFPSQRVFNDRTFAVLAAMTEQIIENGPDWFFNVTTDTHSVNIPLNVGPTFGSESLQPGDYVGVFYDSTSTRLACAGYIRWEGIGTRIKAYGNTNGITKNGFSLDERFQWKLWRSSDEQEFEAEVIYDTINFVQDSLYFSNGLSGITRISVADTTVGIERSEFELDKIVEFDNKILSQSWRLVSLPGADSTMNVADLMVGQVNKIWTAFRFDQGDNLVQYRPSLRDDFYFKPGNGYLIISEDVFVIRDRIVPRVTIGADSVYTVRLKSGWNLISNPYQYLVSWERTRDHNRLRGNNSIIYQYISGRYNRPRVIEPYKAYFFFNVDNLESIDIPHPGKFIPDPEFNFFKLSEPYLALAIKDEVGNNQLPINLYVQDADKAKQANAPYPPAMNSSFRAAWVDEPNSDKVWASSTIDTQSFGNGLGKSILRVDATETGEMELNPVFDQEGVSMIIRKIDEKSDSDYQKIGALSANKVSVKAGTQYFEVIMGKETALIDWVDELPKTISLAQNYPNPFNPSTIISYELSSGQLVALEVYDMTGRMVRSLVNEFKAAGTHQAAFNASGLSSGIYIYRLKTASGIVSSKKMVVLK